jgi:type II secretory ATPase GspE/PulE/Tfp pilus assembly ATPase PilB-like protein
VPNRKLSCAFRHPVRSQQKSWFRFGFVFFGVAISALTLAFSTHADTVRPFSELELKTLSEMYGMMDSAELTQQKNNIMERQIELNAQLNLPANGAPGIQQDIRARIERAHQELDILNTIINKKSIPILSIGGYDQRLTLIVVCLLGAIAVFIVLLFLRKASKTRLRASSERLIQTVGVVTPAGWNDTPGVASHPSSNSQPIEVSADSTGSRPRVVDVPSGAIPIRDIQSHIDHLLINNPTGYNSFLEFIFFQAIAWHASDIHMQRSKGWFEILFRIDGELNTICVVDLYREKELINVIKVMAQLKFDRSTTALDGRIEFMIESRHYDFRVSVIPTLAAEKVVIRIFDDDQTPYDLRRLGLSLATTETWLASLRNRHGLLLIVGPAGMGKTTTIYSSLLQLKSSQQGLNIITLEDPVEHRLDGITQVTVDPERGMTYEMAFTNILRQDPEIIMIGEIRSPVVAKLAVRAGHTGHLVISTIHSASTIGAVDRLIELGVERYNLHNSLIAVMSQRLVKKVCPRCAQPYQPERELVQKAAKVTDPETAQWQHGTGCDYCMGRGYRDRIVIDELIHIGPNDRNRLSTAENSADRRNVLLSLRNHSLWQDGVMKAAAGLTTLEEVAMIMGDLADSES